MYTFGAWEVKGEWEKRGIKVFLSIDEKGVLLGTVEFCQGIYLPPLFPPFPFSSHASCSSIFTVQIFVWEQNLEQFQMDLFRYRCYLASLQGGELPNPKRLLAFASRPTKVAMGRLGIFSVSSFHALVSLNRGQGLDLPTCKSLHVSNAEITSTNSSLCLEDEPLP